ncbi:MAG: ATP-binding protein [Alphaproteobacteria bacterium]|nr:ATP-binding protein [Alphaproteobacteria bacterium]
MGREQIADCFTAVSELWKNSFDAYARRAALHIFDGEYPVAAVVDDGHGMSREEFVNRWLVVGTEAKLTAGEVPAPDRLGLPPRVRQGQKGIGRLSAAFLGPVVLVLSKRTDHPMLAALVDWRMFENPFLLLEDVGIAVEDVEDPDNLLEVIPRLFRQLLDNVRGLEGTADRRARVATAWRQQDAQDAATDTNPKLSESILDTAISASINKRHIDVWPVLQGTTQHGTALFVLGLHRELAIWVGPPSDDEEVIMLKEKLQSSLNGFVDPYSKLLSEFSYEGIVHRGVRHDVFIDSSHVFGLQQFGELEHLLEGEFDEHGKFHGRYRAFGGDLQPFVFSPQRLPPTRISERIGPLHLRIGTYEVRATSSSHPPDQHAFLMEQAERYSGLRVYRDGLRVLPYGRPDSDFFEMEERRSRHAGREFWAHRRVFGRVSITRDSNPNLRDKAGREGLIDNTALREFRLLIIDLLRTTARRYFGTDAPERVPQLKLIEQRNVRAAAALKKASRARKQILRDSLKVQAPLLEQSLQRVAQVRAQLSRASTNTDIGALYSLQDDVSKFSDEVNELRLPARPKNLGNIEIRYREYRDRYNDLRAQVESLNEAWLEAISEHGPQNSREVAVSALHSHQSFLTAQLRGWRKTIEESLGRTNRELTRQVHEDGTRYFSSASDIVDQLRTDRIELRPALNELQRLREELFVEFTNTYEPLQRAADKLARGVDLDLAFEYADDARVQLEDQVAHLYALSQLGITVEIIGHEFEHIDTDVRRNLSRLPLEARHTEAFVRAKSAYDALTQRLRFLNPLKIAGPRIQELITGQEIAQYVRDFFERKLTDERIELVVSQRFLEIRVTELRARIYPVFVNLVNNSLYWLRFARQRQLRLDCIDDAVVVADSGPGVDPDDRDQLFQLFFTRKASGRGVGLYLCRANLAAGFHEIEYVSEGPLKLLDGANFAIHFRGIEHAQA